MLTIYNKSKELIEQRKKATSEADGKISRSVPKNQNIVNVANYPANDDESDFSVKKVIKSNPVISKLKTPAKATGKK